MNSGRGGARKGAGRPKIPGNLKKKQVAFRLPADIVNWLKTQSNQSQVIESALRMYQKLIKS